MHCVITSDLFKTSSELKKWHLSREGRKGAPCNLPQSTKQKQQQKDKKTHQTHTTTIKTRKQQEVASHKGTPSAKGFLLYRAEIFL